MSDPIEEMLSSNFGRIYECMPDSPRVKEIEDHIAQLTAANRQLREENDTMKAQCGSFANINDTCRSRGFDAGPSGRSTEDRVIALAQAYDRLTLALDKAKEALDAVKSLFVIGSDGRVEYAFESDDEEVYRILEKVSAAIAQAREAKQSPEPSM